MYFVSQRVFIALWIISSLQVALLALNDDRFLIYDGITTQTTHEWASVTTPTQHIHLFAVNTSVIDRPTRETYLPCTYL